MKKKLFIGAITSIVALGVFEGITLDNITNAQGYQHGKQITTYTSIENIAMYDRFLQEDIPADVKNVFTSLRDASKNHLSAFQRHVR